MTAQNNPPSLFIQSNPLEADPDRTAPDSSLTHNRVRIAFEKLRPAAEAVKKEDFAVINVPIPSAISIALGVSSKVQLVAEEVQRDLPNFHHAYILELKTYAYALAFAHAAWSASQKPLGNIAEVAAFLIERRDCFTGDVHQMARRGLLSEAFLADQNGTTGYLNVAFDVISLCAVLRGSWRNIEGRTSLTLHEIDVAEERAYAVTSALGEHNQHGADVGFYAERRQRFFTLFMTAYNEVRRAVTFLRWNDGDADDFAPSLYAGRGGTGKKDPVTDPAAPPNGTGTPPAAPDGAATGTPPAASPTGLPQLPAGAVVAPAPVAGSSTSSGSAAPVVTTTASMNNGTLSVETSAAPGMPGHDPFGRT